MDIEKKRATERARYQRNREKRIAQTREWKRQHPEKRHVYYKTWYAKNSDKRHAYYLKNREKQIARQKANSEVLKSNPELLARRREYYRLYQQSRKERNKLKNEARVVFRLALYHGKLKMLPCEICGAEKTQGHHSDYTKPLDVKWLCRKHHSFLHRKY